jgi:TPR repeat protein
MFQDNVRQRILCVFLLAFMAAFTLAANAGDFEDTKRKAEAGEAVAQTNLGSAYFHGKGVAKNYKEAAKWFRKAAEQTDYSGYPMAMGYLLMIYKENKNVVSEKEARKWAGRLESAAEQGNENAQKVLSVLLN